MCSFLSVVVFVDFSKTMGDDDDDGIFGGARGARFPERKTRLAHKKRALLSKNATALNR